MPTHKPVKMWAIVTPSGRIDGYSIGYTREDAISCDTYGPRSTPWKALKAEGYTVRRVLVTPVEENT